jgi:hypothetical protein
VCIVRHANPLLLLQQACLLKREETQLADVICQLSLAVCLEGPESWQISSGHVRPALVAGWGGGVRLRHRLLLLSIVRSFPQALQINSKTSIDIMPPPLPSRLLLVYYSSVTPPFEVHVRLG